MNRGRRAQPIVAVTPDLSPERARGDRGGSILLSRRYADAVLATGGIPVVLPVTGSSQTLRRLLDRVDGVLVTGGDFDIHPRLYGEKPGKHLGIVKESRTDFELELIFLALKRNRPVLGICGGEQAINVALGGSLYQDIASELPHAIEHRQSALKEIGGHAVSIRPGTQLKTIIAKPSLEVNSTHHQAVKRPGQGLIVSATAPDGIIECIESVDHSFVLGVQWHPESLIDKPPQRRLYAAFVGACQNAAGIARLGRPGHAL
jgi:putative glutamine amidotransferase